MNIFTKSSLGYIALMAIPFLATLMMDMQDKTAYATFLTVFNTFAMAIFFLQFPLVGRLKQIDLFANVNWSMLLHRKMGKWMAILFLLHPILILAPIKRK